MTFNTVQYMMQWHNNIHADVSSKFNKVGLYKIWPGCVAVNLYPLLCESAPALYLFCFSSTLSGYSVSAAGFGMKQTKEQR